MIGEVTNNIVNEMGILICHNSEWTSKLDENMVI
jgi:hypothetical protein